MPNRSVIFAIVLAAGLFGLLISGCNNGKRTASGSRKSRGQLAQAKSVRPAEVLSASAHRPQAQVQSAPRQSRQYVVGPRVAEPLPEPVVLAAAPAPRVYAAPAPVYHSAPVVREQPRAVNAGPELAMAQSNLVPMAAPAIQQGYRQQRLSSAPIPELEPVRRHRMPSTLTTSRPVAEVMMSANQGGSRDLQRALAPLADPAIAGQEWVSSPTTAMLK